MTLRSRYWSLDSEKVVRGSCCVDTWIVKSRVENSRSRSRCGAVGKSRCRKTRTRVHEERARVSAAATISPIRGATIPRSHDPAIHVSAIRDPRSAKNGPRASQRRSGFTLLEVIIALGILALGLMVLVDTQATSVLAVTEADRLRTATMLADEKMKEVLLTLEYEGWTDQDIEEDGDYEDFGEEEFRGESLHLEMEEELLDYKWAYTVRAIELNLPPDLFSMADQLAGSGYWDEEKTENMDTSGAPDLTAFGISPDMISEYLADYIREVRVLVWWSEDEDDRIELIHHVINPRGVVQNADDEGT